MKHTPGPWIATGYKNTVVNDSQGNTLALHPSHDGSVENAIANARLISASPQLLEACAILMKAQPMQNGERNGAIMGYISCAIDAARAAIAKATGAKCDT